MQTFHNLMEQMEGDAAKPDLSPPCSQGIAGLNKDLAGERRPLHRIA